LAEDFYLTTHFVVNVGDAIRKEAQFIREENICCNRILVGRVLQNSFTETHLVGSSFSNNSCTD
jgi:hypothetical protein